ncbi:hypothetical protein NQ317_010657 [Molorchus minor]|uniref:Cilia- and flagella-associated protein 52 n=1 Tax=Molorchus minor TaxID=1323400 RepID=A0ABQ9K5N1_9CUCU|nr:hypothetical protein NQ317_010657 [Molorchus minor]
MCDKNLEGDVGGLEIKGIIGFDGSTINGLFVHPDGKHIVYPLGNKVVIQNWITKKQDFLVGHTNIISATAVSASGRYIASGQINHIGFKAMVIVWDFEKRALLSTYEQHKVRVEAVTFSKDDQYVITLGGRDCESVIIWDINKAQVICGTQVPRGIQGQATVVQAMTRRGACFITAGDNHLAIWKVNRDARNVKSVDVLMTKLRRVILCLDINERDEYCYCGTTTGDVLKVRLNYHHDAEVLDPVKTPTVVGSMARLTNKKLPRGTVDLYEAGVRSIRLLFSGQLVIGGGDGTVEVVKETAGKVPEIEHVKMPSTPALKVLKSTHVNGSVTSIQLMDEDTILAATVNAEIYRIRMSHFVAELVVTCHTSTIYDIAFPHNFSAVFATASKDDVRIWSTTTFQEVLRIRVQNFSCSSVVFAHDGKCLLTGWSDGIIRSFTPRTGRLIYAILNAHNKGVSALATTSHGRNLVSGGCEGQVRLWEVSAIRQELICTLKEHKGPVSAIDVNKFDDEAVSASTDGTCIIWDLAKQCRRQILFANTLFMCVRYFPTGVQILTGYLYKYTIITPVAPIGKLGYWEVLDGSLVREVEGSSSGAINALAISPDGDRFVSGGNDQVVKLWKYQEGITTHVGTGHAGVVTCSRFSPDSQMIVTCDASGCIFIWVCPQEPQQEAAKEKKEEAPEKVASPTEEKQEDVKDLPTAKSDKSIKSAKEEEWCKCPSSTSSRSSVCSHGDGENKSKKSSTRSTCSDKSKKSQKK